MTGPPSPPEPEGTRRGSGSGEHVVVGRALVLLILAVLVGVVLIGVAGRPPVLGGATPVATTVTTTTPTNGTGTTQPAVTTTPRATTTTTHRGRGGTTTTTTTVPHSAVKVLVTNGTTTAGAAQHFSQILAAQGWAMTTPVNTTSPVSASAVYYAAGQEVSAGTIAATLKVSPSAVKPLTTSVPVATTSGLDVVVVVGPDLTAQISGTTG